MFVWLCLIVCVCVCVCMSVSVSVSVSASASVSVSVSLSLSVSVCVCDMVIISTLVATFFFLDSATRRHCYKLHMLCSLLTEHIFCYIVAMPFPSECSVAVHMIVVFSMSAL